MTTSDRHTLVRKLGYLHKNLELHEYTEVDPHLVYEHLQHGMGDLDVFMKNMAEWLEEHASS